MRSRWAVHDWREASRLAAESSSGAALLLAPPSALGSSLASSPVFARLADGSAPSAGSSPVAAAAGSPGGGALPAGVIVGACGGPLPALDAHDRGRRQRGSTWSKGCVCVCCPEAQQPERAACERSRPADGGGKRGLRWPHGTERRRAGRRRRRATAQADSAAASGGENLGRRNLQGGHLDIEDVEALAALDGRERLFEHRLEQRAARRARELVGALGRHRRQPMAGTREGKVA